MKRQQCSSIEKDSLTSTNHIYLRKEAEILLSFQFVFIIIIIHEYISIID